MGPATSPAGPVQTTWLSHLPLALLVAAGIAIGGITLLRILGGLGRDRAVDLVLPSEVTGAPIAALGEIEEPYLQAWVERLADAKLGGRDTPSQGLDRAQEWVAAEFRSLGLVPVSPAGAGTPSPLVRPLVDGTLRPYFHPFHAGAAFFGRVPYEAPEPGNGGSRLVLDGLDGLGQEFVPGVDFVPVARSSAEDPVFRGDAEGEIVFAGYGIDSAPYGYDDFATTDVRGRVALVLSGEPAGGAFRGRFGDDEVTAEACLWNKLDALSREGASGALVVDLPAGAGALEYRWTRAYWSPPTMDQVRGGLPTLRISMGAATGILGVSPLDLESAIREAGAPVRAEIPAGTRVRMRAATRRTEVELRNVVGLIPPGPGGRFIVIGAHLDHIGVGPRGRVGSGADDNASGVAAMLAVARALLSPDGARRLGGMGAVFCGFTGEEDGRAGSEALVQELPLPANRCAGMINLDMIGRGPEASAVIFGLTKSPGLRAPVERALATGAHGFDRVQAVTSASFFQRSDHYAFYLAGIPSLFLFEDWPHQPGIYHTWLDTPDQVNVRKVASMARLAALVAFELVR